MLRHFCRILYLLFLFCKGVAYNSTKSRIGSGRLPIVYAFTVSKIACKYGLPEYISFSLKQALISQPDADVILASNYESCAKVKADLNQLLPGVHAIDTDSIRSLRTTQFYNASGNIFQSEGWGELWVTSALRFFMLEDLMIAHKIKEMIHIEADNLLYGSLTQLLPILRKFYKSLAATPLNTSKTFLTASVLWIANLETLVKFNDFMLAMALNSNQTWDGYLAWLRPHACCKRGGVAVDAQGMGLKPYAVNEMSMLAYYRHIARDQLHNLPVVPGNYHFPPHRHIINVTAYAPDGHEAGHSTLSGIWDPNSWGQYLGGTHSKGGRDKGFTDSNHIAGQAMRSYSCRPAMICGNKSMHSIMPGAWGIALNQTYTTSSLNALGEAMNITRIMACYTAPFVHCPKQGATGPDDYGVWIPLWNLHVHSKRMPGFVSQPCACGDENPV